MIKPRISSIENLIATDPGARNVFALVMADQLRLAAQSLLLAKRVGLVSGFFIQQAGAGETDGPPGAKVLGQALETLGVKVDYITDARNAPIFSALGMEPLIEPADYLQQCEPTHLISIERAGRGADGLYRNMHGDVISDVTAPLDQIFLEADQRGITTIGIGDGGNEIGMGKVFTETTDFIELGPLIASVVTTDYCIAAGLSNWGAFGLTGALSVLTGRDLLPTPESVADDLKLAVSQGGAIDGVTHRAEPTTDGVPLSTTLRMLESIRRHLATPLVDSLSASHTKTIGVLGYGETGKAAASLLIKLNHRVRISDQDIVTLEADTKLPQDDVEQSGHTIYFLKGCDLVVVSPGVPADSAILNELHRHAVGVISELELAYQIGYIDKPANHLPLIAVTGTVGKRTTVEMLQTVFDHAELPLAIGGNRGTPLSALLTAYTDHPHIALAVSSFQLESVVHFKPHIAVILNVSEAHLDRHRTIAEYIRIKSRIFMNQGPVDSLILPYEDERLRSLAHKHAGRTLFMSTEQPVERGAWLIDQQLKINLNGTVETLGQVQTEFPENLMATVLIARLCGIELDAMRRVVQFDTMKGVTK